MKDLTFAPLAILVMILLFSCASLNGASDAPSNLNDIAWFPGIDTAKLSASENVDFIPNLKAYQQTTDYTCGPAALLSLAKFYGMSDIGS